MGRVPRLADAAIELADGLSAIRRENEVPTDFPEDVNAAATAAADRRPSASSHADLTAIPFVTLDPATSTDLDQALWITADGPALVLHYAIADVPFFVEPGGAIEQEAWRRGLTVYLPDGKASLYPKVLSEASASLLPDGVRPAIVFEIALDPAGHAVMRQCRRSVIHSRAKLAYDSVRPEQLPEGFAEFQRRMDAAEQARGAARVEFPEQSVERDSAAPGGYRLSIKPRLASEDANAALSLSANLAVADAMAAAGTGLFRVMPEPDDRDIGMLRHIARCIGFEWRKGESLNDVERRLRPADPVDAAFSLAIRRAGGGASYQAFTAGKKPWHAAMAATYAHTTAPLRRLCDRYVLEAALSISAGESIPDHVADAFTKLPDVMREAEQRSNKVDKAVSDLVEVVLLGGRLGDTFAAVVIDTDRHGGRIQLSDQPVIARVDSRTLEPGEDITVRLAAADLVTRQLTFERVR